MKSHFLSPVLIGCILLALTLAGINSWQFHEKEIQDLLHAENISPALTGIPGTAPEFQNYTNTESAGSTTRYQYPAGFLSYSGIVIKCRSACLKIPISDPGNIHSKRYLNHIYPSHNFW